MAEQNANLSPITQGCTNFRNHLRDNLELENFNDFIFSYTFPLKEIEDLKDKARAMGKEPVSLRLYYGCDENGKNHQLYMALLDANREVIVDSSEHSHSEQAKTQLTNPANLNFVMASVPTLERKCPPGGTTSDRLLNGVFS